MSAAPRAVLVTGATGFVGSALVPNLAAAGYSVHALVRPTSDRGALARTMVRWHEADLLDGDAVDRAVASFCAEAADVGATPHVVHGAALISYRTGDADVARRVNVEGTRRVLDACQAHGVARVVHVSSVVAVGFALSAEEALDEDARFNGAPLCCDYVTTKRAAEDFALAVAKQLDVVVVNPGAIFGPGPELSNTSIFLRRVAQRKIGPAAPPGSLAAVGVQDVAEGIRLALERGERGRRYLLTESNLTNAELLSLASVELGVPPPRFVLPAPLWRLAVGAAGLWDRARPLEQAPPQALRLLGVHWRFDAGRARAELGWRPRPFREVLADTVAWLRDAHE